MSWIGRGRLLALAAIAAMPGLAIEVQTAPQARCPCCAEPGTSSEITRGITPEEYAELGRLNFGSVATAAEGRGFRPEIHEYRLVHNGRTRDWTMELHGVSGRGGTLKFTIPDRATFVLKDLQDGRKTAAGGPLLHKEMRMAVHASGSGSFPTGEYRFTLEGVGGSCAEAADYQRWEIRFPALDGGFQLRGNLEKPTPRLGAGKTP